MPQESINDIATQTAAYTTPRRDIFDLVPVDAQTILDVGCSTGALGRSLKAALVGRSVSGIEYSPTFAHEASAFLDHVVTADLNKLVWQDAFGDRFFDCIIFADVLEHLIEPKRCLLQACQHLKPGGCVVISLPNIRHLSVFKAIFLEGRFPQRDRGIFDRTHMRWFTTADAHSMLAECGLKVSAQNVALRWGDTGGGAINRVLNRLPTTIQNWTFVREFLGYQVCMRAIGTT